MKHLKLLVTIICLVVALGIAAPAPPKALHMGTNISPVEGGITKAQVRAYWPDGDLSILRGAGVDFVRIFIPAASAKGDTIPGIRDIAERCDKAGLTPIINFRFPDGQLTANLTDCITWWASLFKGWSTMPADLILDPINEPAPWWPDATWVQKVQPTVYSALRKLAPHQVIILHAGGYEGVAGLPPFVANPGIVLPTDPAELSLIAIGIHEYNLAAVGSSQAGEDAWNLGGLKTWADKLGVRVILTEFGGPDSYGWNDWVNVVASKATTYAKLGIPACLWMHKQLFQSDTPGHRVLRPEVVGALMLPSYAAPTRTDSTAKQPAGVFGFPVLPRSGGALMRLDTFSLSDYDPQRESNIPVRSSRGHGTLNRRSRRHRLLRQEGQGLPHRKLLLPSPLRED